MYGRVGLLGGHRQFGTLLIARQFVKGEIIDLDDPVGCFVSADWIATPLPTPSWRA
jgi:hypothetical protein